MKTNYFNLKAFLVAFLFLAVLTSCEDDLNITPEDNQDTLASDLFANEDAYRQAIAAVYSNLALTGTDGAGSSNIDGLDAGTSQ